jgi:hypothetical protein
MNITTLKGLNISTTCTTIEAYAFYNAGLIRFTVPESVTSIGVYTLAECKSLENTEIKSKIMANYMYQNDTALTTANLTNVTAVSQYAFDGCTALETANINAQTGDAACLTIGQYAFNNCTSLFDVVIPESVTTIGQYAFYNCQSITKMVVPASVTTVGDYVFANNTGLEHVNINNGIIGNYMFQNDTSLLSAIIENATSIGNYAFYNCVMLGDVAIPSTVTSFGGHVFEGCTSIRRASIFASLIGEYAFYGCTALEHVNYETLAIIPQYAFYGCVLLQNPVFTDRLLTIGQYAFAKCYSMDRITIPNSVTELGLNVFWDVDIV